VLVKDFSYGILEGAEFLEDRIGIPLIVGELASCVWICCIRIRSVGVCSCSCTGVGSVWIGCIRIRFARPAECRHGGFDALLRVQRFIAAHTFVFQASFVRGVSAPPQFMSISVLPVPNPVHHCLLLCCRA